VLTIILVSISGISVEPAGNRLLLAKGNSGLRDVVYRIWEYGRGHDMLTQLSFKLPLTTRISQLIKRELGTINFDNDL